MLGIGLMLFCLRGPRAHVVLGRELLGGAFWTLNIGLARWRSCRSLRSEFLQVHAAVTHGFWYARSAEFLQQPLIQTLVWMRMPGDVLFGAGVVMLAIFVLRLFVGKAKDTVAGGDSGQPVG
jgi:nitric oxide reductase subunit B